MILGQAQATSATFWKVGFICTGLILVAVALDMPALLSGADLRREGGGVETISALLLFATVGVFVALVPARFWAPLYQIPALMMLFGMRELDLDKAFTPSGILSTRLYSGDHPLSTKLISAIVVLFILVVVARMARHGIPAAIRGVRDREPWAFFAVTAAFLTVATKAIDGLVRKLAGIGVEASQQVDVVASTIEEVGECYIPIFAILAIVARWKGRSA